MATIIIEPITVYDLEQNQNFNKLLKEYGDECHIAGLPPIVDKLTGYKAIERSGVFKLFGAFSMPSGADKILIGFVAVISAVIPHYGTLISVAESLFVGKNYRHLGAGLKLIQFAEYQASLAGSPGLLLSAPKDGVLEKILPRCGYRETNTTFFKDFT